MNRFGGISAAAALGGYALALAAAAHLAPDPGAHLLREQSAAIVAAGKFRPYQRISKDQGDHVVEYGFLNFNGDPSVVRARVPDALVAAALEEFGLSSEAFRGLSRWYAQAEQQAWDRYNAGFVEKVQAPADVFEKRLAEVKAHNERLQAELESDLASLQKERARRRDRLYLDAGMRFVDEQTITVDMRWLVQRNAPRLRAAAVALDQLAAERGYGTEELVGAVVAMAQTALDYRIPPEKIGDRETLGVLPPPAAFTRGWGDCDTKSALVAAILAGWKSARLVGVSIPKHYLLGVRRVPGPGEAYLEYRGLPYVLVEPVGPAWAPPGEVSDLTREYMQTGGHFTIEPLLEGT